MKRETLKTSIRSDHGTSYARKLRREGQVPAILYGHGSETKPLVFESRIMEHFLSHHGVGATVDLNVDGISVFAMIKDYQRANLTRELLHVDFQELHKGEKVRLNVPIYFVNREKVEDSQQVLVEQLHEIEVSTLPKDLVEYINVDVSHLKIGDAIQIMDLDMFKDDKYEVWSDPDTVIVSLTNARAQEPEEEESDEIASIAIEVVDQATKEETEE